MNAHELAKQLLELPAGTRVVYPGAETDLEVEIVGELDGVAILSNEGEAPGVSEPRAPSLFDATTREGLAASLIRATENGRGLLVVVHECFALLAAARPTHWILSGELLEASDWIRRQGVLLSLIDQAGAAPPPKKPEGLKEKVEEMIGVDAGRKLVDILDEEWNATD